MFPATDIPTEADLAEERDLQRRLRGRLVALLELRMRGGWRLLGTVALLSAVAPFLGNLPSQLGWLMLVVAIFAVLGTSLLALIVLPAACAIESAFVVRRLRRHELLADLLLTRLTARDILLALYGIQYRRLLLRLGGLAALIVPPLFVLLGAIYVAETRTSRGLRPSEVWDMVQVVVIGLMMLGLVLAQGAAAALFLLGQQARAFRRGAHSLPITRTLAWTLLLWIGVWFTAGLLGRLAGILVPSGLASLAVQAVLVLVVGDSGRRALRGGDAAGWRRALLLSDS